MEERKSTEVINLIPQIWQLFQENSDIGMILQTLFSLSFIIYLFYAQRIQAMTMLRQVEGTLMKVKAIKDEGRKISIDTIKEIGKPEIDPTPLIDRFIEFFAVTPVNLDPAGIIGKLDHLLNLSDDTVKAEVRAMAPEASEAEINNLENLLGATHQLNAYYKVIRHFYLLGKKTMNIYVIMQVHMVLPLLVKEIEAVSSAVQAFKDGIPIGDSVGPMVAAKLMRGYDWSEVAKEMVAAEVPFMERTMIVTKAKGPGGSVGKPGAAIENIINGAREDKKVSAVIMVDAAMKLEGETTGAVHEGIGATIGGIGVEKFKIEEIVREFNIPVYGIAIKQDIGQAIGPMVEEIYKAVDVAIESVNRMIKERTEAGDIIIVAGIGNTIGVAQ